MGDKFEQQWFEKPEDGLTLLAPDRADRPGDTRPKLPALDRVQGWPGLSRLSAYLPGRQRKKANENQ
jgi:hypothetical protein